MNIKNTIEKVANFLTPKCPECGEKKYIKRSKSYKKSLKCENHGELYYRFNPNFISLIIFKLASKAKNFYLISIILLLSGIIGFGCASQKNNYSACCDNREWKIKDFNKLNLEEKEHKNPELQTKNMPMAKKEKSLEEETLIEEVPQKKEKEKKYIPKENKPGKRKDKKENCCPEREEQEVNPRLKIFFWNETDYGIKVTLIRDYTPHTIYINSQDFHEVDLTEGGEIKYYVSAYDNDMKMPGKSEGRFEIMPTTRLDVYRGKIAGKHIKINNLRWDRNRSKIIFGTNNIIGKLENKNHGTEITVETPAQNTKVRLRGPIAVLANILSNRQ